MTLIEQLEAIEAEATDLSHALIPSDLLPAIIATLKEQAGEVERLRDEGASTAARVSLLRGALEIREAQLDGAHKGCDELQKISAKHRTTIAELEHEITRLTSDLQAAREECERLRAELTRTRDQHIADLRIVDASSGTLHDLLAVARAEIEALKADLGATESRLDTAYTEIEALKKSVNRKRYRCLDCGAFMTDYSQFEEYQHDGCGGLVVDVEEAIRLMKMREAERDAARHDADQMRTPRPFADWHEDIGSVLWWLLPVCEPPYCGTPLDDDWPYEDDEQPVWTVVPLPLAADKEGT